MRVLVTGATGFIGSYLVEELINQGYEVRCLVRKTSNVNFIKIFNNVEIFYGDLIKKETLLGIADDVDYVFHLAAKGHVSAVTKKAFEDFTSVNDYGTKNLIEECMKNNKILKFVHFSSTAAMGLIEKKGLTSETDEPQPKTPYQKSKRRSEIISIGYFTKHNFPVVVLRPCMVYGPRGKGEFYKFCQLIKKGIFPKIGLGNNLTPLIYVEDLTKGAIKALKDGRPGEVYLMASPKSYVLDEIRNTIMSSLGIRRPYLYIPKWAGLIGAKLIEILFLLLGKEPIVTYHNIKSTVTDREFDISKANKDFGFLPETKLLYGVNKTIAWYKMNNMF